eukprot:706816-Hanusia_phi.AAC.4
MARNFGSTGSSELHRSPGYHVFVDKLIPCSFFHISVSSSAHLPSSLVLASLTCPCPCHGRFLLPQGPATVTSPPQRLTKNNLKRKRTWKR